MASEPDQLDQRALSLMEEADSDSRTRVYSGVADKLLSVLLVGFALFQLWANLTGTLGAVKLRTAHILILLPLVRRAASKQSSRHTMPTRTSVSFRRPVLASAS